MITAKQVRDSLQWHLLHSPSHLSQVPLSACSIIPPAISPSTPPERLAASLPFACPGVQPSIAVKCPVRIIQGDSDPHCLVEGAERLLQRLQSPDKQLVVVPGGDHRLSTPEDLSLLQTVLEPLLE